MRFAFLVLILSVSTTTWAAPEPDSQRFEKLQAVLAHLGIAEEPSRAADAARFDGAQTRKGFETIIKYIDPKGELKRYVSWDDQGLTLFRDRDTKKVADFSLAFKQAGAPADAAGVLRHLKAAALNSAAEPLKGLRIALDPGHMGGKFWDQKTGKYVRTKDGYVSEGVIALQTCLLLGEELKKLGAEVLLTRDELDAVAEEKLEQYVIKPYAELEVLNNTDSPWFDALLASQPLGPKLLAAAAKNAQIKNLYSQSQRDKYFIFRVDLSARARKINAFKPHLTLVVHFDASHGDRTYNGANIVRGYVAGNFMNGEVASRETRFQALSSALNGHRFVESSVFTAAVVGGIAEATGIKVLRSPEDYQAIKVGDGVYARNLALNRLVSEGVMTYVEVMHYDHTPEFRRLAVNDRHVTINGKKIDYSSRLDDIVDGFKKGILDYVGSKASKPKPVLP